MVNKQIDAPHQPPAGADDNLHNIFIKDVLNPPAEDSTKNTPKKEPEKSETTPGPNPLFTSGEMLIIPPVMADIGQPKGDEQSGKKGETDKKGDGKKLPYRSPFGSVQDTVNYLDLDNSFKQKARPFDPLTPFVGPQPQKPGDKPDVKKAEVLPLPKLEIPKDALKPDAKKDAPLAPPVKPEDKKDAPKPDAKKDAPLVPPVKPEDKKDAVKPDAKKDAPLAPPVKPDDK
ncbi:MAG: hypothetical protein K2X93_11415 [Candidatus Obscuribacterales bacterium]|nr:hypothetical protein [Candidatus Obscuribacterales bacterium]